ncbi:hypothetical protein EMIHUDRAFT_453350 [Emiliania huxleyi CCMP1516]|uniref:TIR domain-containing protein n=2 Tax=Emiliania huxleyi TaxID=2903 RepID=A0A0D3I6L1_EMIH1|nr:hypothetical protein EMIHUDRAFT_453350 [Emiliania huxleyi CCMP1516]EOD06896.1 hypothetical protein EMIHUDRAFT_453350 [Emiliania huxleyi CCMP1516]|eukprot:XP_005759325.1 hypothetical protein EMIHUDRAFT_453350 [Emiliania huxleyi CCMP1516]
MTAKVKILFGFYQISTVLSSTYSARLPDKYTSWTDNLANAISIDWSGFFLPEQCLGYGMRLLAIALSPVALIALLMIAGISALSQLMTAELEQVSYMRQDASVECGSDDHGPITTLATGFIVLWPAGSLVLFTSLLAACYKPLQAKSPNALTRAAGFLHREYEKTWYWWEAVELARKLVLTGFVLLIPEERAFVRLVVATLICSCYAVALAVVRPYKRVEDNVLAVATSLVLLLLFLGTNWSTTFLGIQERYQGADPADVLGFRSLNVIVDSMIILVAVVLAFFLVGAIAAARRVAKIPTIRLVSTKQPPELSIAMGLTWHLFNSHIWSTGQDAVKVIKGELEQLLPDIKVDDLKDIGALEEYIQSSQVILFFLSQGYFRSKARLFLPPRLYRTLAPRTAASPAPQNCLREVRSSLEKDKPLVLVQEADPEKGGGTLQALRDECPEDLQPAIFDNDWPLTIWYRIDEFQLISLKIIAEAPPATTSSAVLLCSPNFLDRTSLPLCVSGELESQSLAFSKPCTLWASPANAGSLALADEIAAAFAPDRETAGLTICTTDDRPASATHLLLYLNEDSFVSDERLAEQVKQAREDKLKIVMAHENDPALGGCQFSRFFEVTPQELIAGGLYKDLAKSCFPGHHRKVSLVLLAKSLGATPARSRAGLLASGSVVEGSTSLAKRSLGGLSRVFAKMSSRSSAEARDSGGEASSVQQQV